MLPVSPLTGDTDHAGNREPSSHSSNGSRQIFITMQDAPVNRLIDVTVTQSHWTTSFEISAHRVLHALRPLTCSSVLHLRSREIEQQVIIDICQSWMPLRCPAFQSSLKHVHTSRRWLRRISITPRPVPEPVSGATRAPRDEVSVASKACIQTRLFVLPDQRRTEYAMFPRHATSGDNARL